MSYSVSFPDKMAVQYSHTFCVLVRLPLVISHGAISSVQGRVLRAADISSVTESGLRAYYYNCVLQLPIPVHMCVFTHTCTFMFRSSNVLCYHIL